MSESLRRVVDNGLCAGCGACEELGQHVRVEVQPSGFIRPVTSRALTPTEEVRFKSYCPGHGLTAPTPLPTQATQSLYWGPVIESRVGFATDARVRFEASSGGVLTALLVHLIESRAVDAVIQVAAATSPPYGNSTVVSSTAEEVIEAAGSRYAPSAPLEGLCERLDGVTRFAFVGKPCDVAALRALARLDARIDRQIRFVFAFFCAGVPSLRGAREIVDQLGVDPEQLTEFRYRGHGWPGRATAVTRDGASASMTYAESWGGILSRHVQLRCRICPDGVGAYADVACADAWETDADGFPRFEERDGESLILSRTPAGEELVRTLVEQGRLEVHPVPVSMIDSMQPGQVSKATLGPVRAMALKSVLRPVPRFRGFHPVKRSRQAGIVQLARQYLGTLRRAWERRLLG